MYILVAAINPQGLSPLFINVVAGEPCMKFKAGERYIYSGHDGDNWALQFPLTEDLNIDHDSSFIRRKVICIL
jgi:hypothetical protein